MDIPEFLFLHLSCFRGVKLLRRKALRPYLKDGHTLKGMGVATMTLWEFPESGHRGPFDFYFDAPQGFILLFGKKAVACAACKIDKAASVVTIVQVQGKRHKKDMLSAFRWEKFLVAYLTGWARARGFKEVWVQPAEKNKWRNNIRKNALHLRYDVTAKRLGFRFREDCGHFVKSLQ